MVSCLAEGDGLHEKANNRHIVLAVYDPASTRGDDVDKAMEYVEKEKRPTVLVHPDTFEIILITKRHRLKLYNTRSKLSEAQKCRISL